MDVFFQFGFEKLTETVVGKRGCNGKAYKITSSCGFSYFCGEMTFCFIEER